MSVCIPALNESPTVGRIVDLVVREMTRDGGGVDLVGEVLVVDDGSTDDTAALARKAGARVVSSSRGPAGKGRALRVALSEAEGDVIVFLDADVTNFSSGYVSALLGPLLDPRFDGEVSLVKGFYERPLDGRPGEGGRVTELVAKPLIALSFPEIAHIRQPLAGETAAHREVLDKVELADGYGVELGLLIDVADRFGAESIAQVDLGVRVHRNRPLNQLRAVAEDVMRTGLERATR